MMSQEGLCPAIGQDDSNLQGQPDYRIFSESLSQLVWRNWWIVLLVLFVALLSGVIYLIGKRPIYTSTARVYVQQNVPKLLKEAEVTIAPSRNYLYTQAELLKSTPILTGAIDNLDLVNMRTFSTVDDVITFLKKSLDVSVGKNDEIISVSFGSAYPAEAAKLVNLVVESYISYNESSKRDTAGDVLKILRKGKLQLDKDVAEKLKAMTDFKKGNANFAFAGQRSNVILDRLSKLSEAMTQAQLQTIESESLYQLTQLMVTDPVKLKQFVEGERAKGAYAFAASERSKLQAQLDELQVQYDGLTQQVVTHHPAVQLLSERIGQLKERLEAIDKQFAEAQLAIVEQRYLSAKEKEEQVREHFERQRQQAIALNEQVAQYTALESSWQQAKKLCDILDERIKEIDLTEEGGALNITILEQARATEKPSKPQKVRVMGIALLAGLLFGCGLACLRSCIDRRPRSLLEASFILGVPILGAVPTATKKRSISAVGRKVYLDPNSRVAEAYRAVRTTLIFGSPKNRAKTIVVTSPTAGDGKTTLASNLGIALAQAQQHVLLVDVNLHNPMQHKVFKVAAEPGLSSVLAHGQLLDEVVRHSCIAGLDLLLSGPKIANSSEIIAGKAFANTKAVLASKYDYIVIDTPPVLSTSDACILAALCDVAVIVYSAKRSTRMDLEQTRNALQGVGARVFGAIVNKVSHNSGLYDYRRRNICTHVCGQKKWASKTEKEGDLMVAGNLKRA
jgi:succinoglycan biosynthesis transport protein ExoP